MRVVWTEDKIAKMAKMWAEGDSPRTISKAMKISEGCVRKVAMRNREKFTPRRPRNVPKAGDTDRAKAWRSDRFTRITRDGVSITMPRVTFIDGPARAAE